MNINNLKDAIGMLDDLLIDEAIKYDKTVKSNINKAKISEDPSEDKYSLEPSVISGERKSIFWLIPAAASVFLIVILAFQKNPDNNVNDRINISTSGITTTSVSSSAPQKFISTYSDTHPSVTTKLNSEFSETSDTVTVIVSPVPAAISDTPAATMPPDEIPYTTDAIPETEFWTSEQSTEPVVTTASSDIMVTESVAETSPNNSITISNNTVLYSEQYVFSPEGIKKYTENTYILKITPKDGVSFPKDEINNRLSDSMTHLREIEDHYESYIGNPLNKDDVLNILLDYDEIKLIEESSILEVYEDVYIAYITIKGHHNEDELISSYGEFLERFSGEKEINGGTFRTAAPKINFSDISNNDYCERLKEFLSDSNITVNYSENYSYKTNLSKIIYEAR